MTNSELNKLSIAELRSLNQKIVQMIKLKLQIEGKLNADNLEIGMIVKYKGNSQKIKNEKFVINKINKVNAECKMLRTNQIWNINLANIECADERYSIYEKEPESGFQN